MASGNGWSKYQKLVLSKLTDNAGALNSLKGEVSQIRTEDIPAIRVEIAMLQVKAGIWGAAAGTVPVALAVAFIWIKNHF